MDRTGPTTVDALEAGQKASLGNLLLQITFCFALEAMHPIEAAVCCSTGPAVAGRSPSTSSGLRAIAMAMAS